MPAAPKRQHRSCARSKPAAGRLFEAAESRLGGVDVLVNNAGIMALGDIAEADDETFDRMVAVNLKGTFNTLREAARRLRNGGRIINFSSSVLGLYLPGYAVDAATKAGAEAMTPILARELRGAASPSMPSRQGLQPPTSSWAASRRR